MAAGEHIRCRDRLEVFLRAERIPYEILRHRQAYTMPEVAAALLLSGSQVERAVTVEAKEEMTVAGVPTAQRLRLSQHESILGAKTAKLARKREFGVLFPDCATGTMPPFGPLYQVPVYLEQALAREETVVFRIGTYRHALRMAMSDYRRLVR